MANNKRLALVFLALLTLSYVFPTSTSASVVAKPSVALVLGGGSAWGLSHKGSPLFAGLLYEAFYRGLSRILCF